MKKLLIIQLDGAYFLEETFRVLEKFHASFKDFELTILVSSQTLKDLTSAAAPLISGITTDESEVLNSHFDLSFNLSMDESSWDLHGKVKSSQKYGCSVTNGQLEVPDLWSTFLLTIKANAPFLTFHLQDIYCNILGIRRIPNLTTKITTIKDLVVGNFNESFFTLDERETLVSALKASHPHLTIRNILEVDVISDLTHTLYIGPATVESLRMGEAGAISLFLSRNFQGFNLLPNAGKHFIASSRGEAIKTLKVLPLVTSLISHGKPTINSDYSIYEIDHENLYGAYLHSLNRSDEAYPFYQSHVVLWNFLLNLFDVNLDIVQCSPEQLERMKQNQLVLNKLIRLHDYAMSSVDLIYLESKAEVSRADKIDGHLKNLADIDGVMGKISHTHPMLRPFLDFYRIRRGQNNGSTLAEQIQHTYLTYTEEHHALMALNELFSVTLRKNEASI
ncbi:MAG TPA: hypothetical protein VNJ08_03410 [Bacteriovoracaceae bacterium]|nr:hypothetical protein [Bacteriovoracaceae bacterium]